MAKQKKGLTLSLGDVLVEHMNITAVDQEDGKAALHDTVKVNATCTADKLSEVLGAMGVSKTKFMQNGPAEVPKVHLATIHYEGHKAVLSGGAGGDNLVATMADAELADFRVERLSSDTFALTFKVKGIPDSDSHVSFEASWLDSKTGVQFALEIEPPAQVEMSLEESGEEEQQEEEETA